MKSQIPKQPRLPRNESEPGRRVARLGLSNRRVSIVVCLLAVLATSLGAAAVSRLAGRPTRAEVGAAVAGVPNQGPMQTYTASITNGASQNDLYEWLAGRAGSVVHLVLSISKPTVADLKTKPQVITLSSNCSGPTPPANCAPSLNLAGTRYQFYGDTSGLVTLSNGIYNVDAYLAVDPITLDSKNMVTLPLHVVSSGAGE
jgi:hypothetical protein